MPELRRTNCLAIAVLAGLFLLGLVASLLTDGGRTMKSSSSSSSSWRSSSAASRHPRYGKNVIFNIERGQIPCHSFSPCTALVRFDDAPAVSYSAAGPEDNSTETIFINDYSGFVAKMQKAKTVRISVNVFQEGSPVFEFDVSGFDANKYKPK